MQRIFTLLVLIFLAGLQVQAQMETPASSPSAMVKQTAGLTDITINYSSPGVKGRTIFGDLVPYGEVWRTGANKATSIAFSRDVVINGTDVKAGTYSIFTIPGEREWTIMLNSETELWGSDDYNADNDVVRVKAMPVKTSFRERFAVDILDFDNEKATIVIEWEKTRVAFIVELKTKEQAYASIEKTLNPAWNTFAAAARYAWEQEGDLASADKWITQSLALQEMWYNHWIKGEVLAGMGQYAEALVHMNKALELGNRNVETFWYKSRIEKNIQEWAKK